MASILCYTVGMNMKQTIGAGLVIIGVFYLLVNLNIPGINELARYFWSLLVMFVGTLMLLSGAQHRITGFIVLGVGFLLFLQRITDGAFSIWTIVWPAIIMAIGISFLLNRNQSSKNKIDKDTKELNVFLSGITKKYSEETFSGFTINTVMGGVELDLSKARFEKEATIDANVIMGGLELRLPEEVIVKNHTTSIMGGIDEKAMPSADKNAPCLTITGTVLMGGIEIKR